MVSMSFINLSLERLIKDHSDATPASGDVTLKKSIINLVVDDEKKKPDTEFQSLILHIGAHK